MLGVAKMGLWDRLLPLLESSVEGLRISTLDFIAVCSRNNPEAAQHLAGQDVLRRLVESGCRRPIITTAITTAIDASPAASTQEVRKLISACSALFQSVEGGFANFVRLDGLAMFAQLLEQHGTQG